ncbi:MAG: hypothetical protein OP8BY_1068 [Candidatus Saccharicenans subterraneus]|uniref:Uncharacterized protein n=1 Tax=Candidatus Saccharicenans subterraneus TaxID=2508984 RepID=A0A3E2BR75_9BACT|nr:MAG: hypothetical protein OP8BY_1068 [Candidatus Saccharicenans subterraneum]
MTANRSYKSLIKNKKNKEYRSDEIDRKEPDEFRAAIITGTKQGGMNHGN